MSVQIGHSVASSPSARVAREVVRKINSGHFPPGTPLPSADKLAAELKVDRKTVHRAIRNLVERGVISAPSPRIRIVNSTSEASAGVLSATVAVFTTFGQPTTESKTQSGWIDVINRGVSSGVHAHGKNILIVHHDQHRALPARLAIERPYGLIVTEAIVDFAELRKRLDPIRSAGVPVVVYGSAPELAEYDRVTSDHAAGAYALTRGLIERGRRRILNVWNREAAGRHWVSERRIGYERAMNEAGLEPLEPVLTGPFPDSLKTADEFEYHARAIAGFLVPSMTGREPADAIMTLSDRDCFATAAACRVFGKTPGVDVAIAGYDNCWKDCLFERSQESSVPCATVDKRNFEIGQALVQMLVDRVEGKLPGTPQTRVIEPALVFNTTNEDKSRRHDA